MKTISIYITSALTVATIFQSCQVELAAPNMSSDNSITMTALAVPDENLSVRLSLTDSINSASTDPYASSYVMWRFMKFSIFNPTDTLLTADYYNNSVIKDAKVTALINGNEYRMNYDKESHNFICDYKPQPGDNITISAIGENDNPVSGSVTVPTHKGGIELISAEKIYKEPEHYSELGLEESGTDSVMMFKLKITDKTSKTNCYRLKVTACSSSQVLCPNSAYLTFDPLLYDSSIEKPFGTWPAFQTDVFSSDRLHNGEYVITVSSRLPFKSDDTSLRYFVIELQPISRELMEYLSVLYRLRVATDSYFSEPVSLPSNIEGGVGIFGAIGESSKITYWLPGEEKHDI